MSNEPSNKIDPTQDQGLRRQSGGAAGSGSNSRSSNLPVGAPDRRDLGDRTDDESETMNAADRDAADDDAESDRSDEQSSDDDVEGGKSPRFENTGRTDDRTEGDRSNPGQQRNDQSNPMQGGGRSGAQGGASPRDSEGKSGYTQGGGSGR